MTNPTQPIEHYTLEQVEQKAADHDFGEGKTVFMRYIDLHALINDCINERIGEPVAVVYGYDEKGHIQFSPKPGLSGLAIGTKLYTLKEPKP